MFVSTPLLLSASLLLILTSAFTHPKGAADGLYIHRIDAVGNEVTEYMGIPKGAPTALQASQHVQRANFHARDSILSGFPTCTSNIMNAKDLSSAQNGLASWCQTGQRFDGAVSYVSGTANAYVCAYRKNSGANKCDQGTVQRYYGMAGGNCGGSMSGFYIIPSKGVQYGYDLAGACFCHCKPPSH
ncbi:hypothetical protein MMC13_003788 [Lambiella insularis]|nr:hypothetical protein [Lambiella insularis]